MRFDPGRKSEVDTIAAADEGAVRTHGGAEIGSGGPKYETVGPIGRGGMGVVMLVRDRDLRRDVAMKVLREEFASNDAMRRKFVAEAQATSQLEHPGIPPVHDIGASPDGTVYFTMKVVRGRTLTDVLKDLFLGRKETRAEYTMHKLATVMERICETVHFAHEKGVLHRDLKPDNVMLGEFGEVHVMDWGIAKVAADRGDTTAGVSTVDEDGAQRTKPGTIKGTVPYMSPEQARGDSLDRRSDVYSLGAVLYEVLTLLPAFEGTAPQILDRVRAGDVPPVETRNPRREVPEPLAALCRRAMSLDPAARPPTAIAFARELRTWLDGRAERDRRHAEAEEFAARGREAFDRWRATGAAVSAARRAHDDVSPQYQPWQPFEEKSLLRAAADAVDRARRDEAHAFADTVRFLEGALLAEPGNATARSLLADVWRVRLERAEARRDAAEADFALRTAERFDDGRLRDWLRGDGTLSIESRPPGALVSLVRFEDRSGVLVPGEERHLGETPLGPVALPMGTYLATLRHPGFPDVPYPVHITRGREWRGVVRLATAAEIGPGFVHVPGGPFATEVDGAPAVVDVPSFAIAARPVTFAEWSEFLASVEREHGLDAARKLAPRVRGDGEYMERCADGTWRASELNVEGPSRDRLLREHGPGFEMDLPVCGVDWHDAMAYCAWRSQRTGLEWRLPTSLEREKAARGVDGRLFPWGHAEEATFGKCQLSRNEPSQPEPVGCFPRATSVYGVVDSVGNSFDWTSSWSDARRSFRLLRGCSWHDGPRRLRCANFWSAEPWVRHIGVGFRPARSLPQPPDSAPTT